MSDVPPESKTIDEQDNSFVTAELVDDSLGSCRQNRLSMTGIISWLVVIAVTVGVVVFVALGQQLDEDSGNQEASPVDLMQVKLVGKMLVGQQELKRVAANLQGDANEDVEIVEDDQGNVVPMPGLHEDEIESIESAIKGITFGTYEQRLAVAVLFNELLGAERAQEHLRTLEDQVVEYDFEPSEKQAALRFAIANIIDANANDSFDDATVSLEEEVLLEESLGWIGELATVPAIAGDTEKRKALLNEAAASAMVATVAGLIAFAAMVAGFILFVMAFRNWRRGHLQGRFTNQFGVHNLYIETFALWLVYFFGGQFALAFLPQDGFNPLASSVAVMFTSLLVLLWPVVRGTPFAQVRNDIGWFVASPRRDFLVAPIGYLATLPLVLLAFVVMIGFITQAAEPSKSDNFFHGAPISHPIQEFVSQGDVGSMLLIVLATCVAAPIVEETMFRGVLYRHLRDVSAHWRLTTSIVFSCLINAFIFAAIHPQGVLLIPVLGALAVGFSLMREWRDSLFPSMIMHAMHNGAVTCMTFLIL